MEPASASDYVWIDDTPLCVAGCLTVVTGMTANDVLADICGDRGEVPMSGSTARFGVARLPGGSEMRVGVTAIPGGVLVVEDNGFVGAVPDVLARLSASGRAASMFWNVNEHNAFSFAENGQLLGFVDLFDAEDPGFADEIGLPVELRDLFSAAGDEDADLHATGLAMVATFTGVQVRCEDVEGVDIDTLRGR
jgi:hypothetical protein